MRPYAWAEKARAPICRGSGGGGRLRGLQGALVTERRDARWDCRRCARATRRVGKDHRADRPAAGM